MAHALDDLRVVELGTGEGVALACRFLAELGAEVIKVEPPAGDPLRLVPPFWGKSSYLFEILAAGKRSLVLDLADDLHLTTLHDLLSDADVLITGESRRTLARHGLEYEQLGGANPSLIYCSLTAFGQSGPYADRPGSDIVAQALSGTMMVNGREDEPPCKCGPKTAEAVAATHALIGLLAALHHRDNTGRGQNVDVSAQDSSFYMHGAALPSHYVFGKAFYRGGNRHGMLAPYNVYHAADGWVIVGTGNDEQWQRLCRTIGRDELAVDPRFATLRHRTALVEEVDGIVTAWTSSRPVAAVVAELNAADVPAGPVQTVADLLVDPQLLDRRMVATLPHPAGPVHVPGSVFNHMSVTPGSVRRAAPPLGELSVADLAPRPASPQSPCSDAAPSGAGPLSGLKVIEPAHFAAGPICPRLLADLGAEVIKIEPPGRGEGMRFLPPTMHGTSYIYQMHNSSKLGLSLDLRKPAGRDILLGLAREADVLVENYSVGVMDKLGVGYGALSALNPRLVFCSVTGFGQFGPNRDRPAFDQIIQARSGLMSLGGWPSGEPQRAYIAGLDYFGPFFAAGSILAALHYRYRSGQGQRIDVCMNDVGAFLTYSAWPARFAKGVTLERYGNSYPFAAPYNAYQAADSIIVIGVDTEEQWQGLLRAMGDQGAALAGRYDGVAARLARAAEIDALVGAWVAGRMAADAVSLCLEHGVPASGVLGIPQAIADPQLAAREMLVTVHHARAGDLVLMGTPMKLSLTPGYPKSAGPDVGQHSAQVLASHLGYTAGQIASLQAKGVI